MSNKLTQMIADRYTFYESLSRIQKIIYFIFDLSNFYKIAYLNGYKARDEMYKLGINNETRL